MAKQVKKTKKNAVLVDVILQKKQPKQSIADLRNEITRQSNCIRPLEEIHGRNVSKTSRPVRDEDDRVGNGIPLHFELALHSLG